MGFLKEVALVLDELGRIRELSKLEGITNNITAKDGSCE